MKQLIATLALVALLACGLSAQPAPAADGPHHGQMRMPGLPPGLDLTLLQQSQIEDLQLAHLKEMIPLRAEAEKHHTELKTELIADKYNESKVKTIQAELAKIESDIALKQFSHLRAVRDILIPEQKKKFDIHVLAGGPGFGGPMDHGFRPGAAGPGGPMHRMGMGHGQETPPPAPMPDKGKS
jgi:Spy/CpxP family protein refolding chaperone